MKKRILLLGANGFIGRNLIEQLGQKYDFSTPTSRELDLRSTTRVDKYFSKNGFDVVINAAVIGGSRKEEYERGMLEENLRMFFNIVRNKSSYKKLIHFGSGAEYDKSRPLKKVKEEDFDKRVPQDEYGFYKYICSKYIEKVDSIVNLRIFGLFGKYEDHRYRFISNAIVKNLKGLPITIRQNVLFDYLYIDDFVKIVDYFINNDTRHKFYNIGTGKPINLVKIANEINKVADNKSKIVVKNKGLNKEYTCNSKRLASEIKGFKFTNFNKSLLELYGWYKNNLKFVDRKFLRE